MIRERPTRAAPTVLFFHGETGNLDYCWRKVMNIWDSGFNVLAVDYRGYGKSTGAPDEAGLYDDARASWEYLASRNDVDPDRIVIWGYSLGTGVASQLATEVDAAALVLEAPFTSMRALIERSSPYAVAPEWISTAEFRTLKRIGDARSPVVVAHGTADVRVPAWMGVRVFTAAPMPRRLILVDGGRHDNLLKKARARIRNALSEVNPILAP